MVRVPTRVTAQVRPPAAPLRYVSVPSAQPSAFGATVARSIGEFGTTLSAVGDQLEQNRLSEARVRANGALARFEIDQTAALGELDRTAENQSAIDMQFSEQFIAGADSLLETAPDQATRDYMANQLVNLYRGMQLNAQQIEISRNEDAVRFDLDVQFDDARNIVLTDPTRLDEQSERLSVALTEAETVLSAEEVRQQTRAYLSGTLEAAELGRIMGAETVEELEAIRFELLNGFTRAPNEAALIYQESGGNPQAFNQFGFAGLYQFGAPQLQTLGVYSPGSGENLSNWNDTPNDAEGKWSGTFAIPGHPNVRTVVDFLENPAAQAAVYQRHLQWIDGQIVSEGLDQYIGQTIRGVLITRSGLQNMIHFAGVGGAKATLEGRANPTDANGASALDYARLGANVIGAAGGPQALLSPDQILNLVNDADQEIASRQRERDQQRNLLFSQAEGFLDAAQTEIQRGAQPDLTQASTMAVAIGGQEGLALLQQIDFMESLKELTPEFVRGGAEVRSATLLELEAQRQRGELGERGIAVHDFLTEIDEGIRADGRDNGYGLAVQYGVISQPVQLDFANPQSIQQREIIAAAVKAHFGGEASVLTPDEKAGLSEVLRGADPNAAYEVMRAFADTPLLAAEIQSELADSGTPEGMTLAVAFDLAGQGLENDAKAVMTGQLAINSGTGVPDNTTMRTAAINVLGDAFEGMDPRLVNSYLAAAAAHYVGTNPNWEGVNAGTPDPTRIEQSLRSVLPGQIVTWNAGWVFGIGGYQIMTPSRDMGQEEWNDTIAALEGEDEWWRNVVLINPATRETRRLEEPPTYPNGDPIAVTDFTREGELRTGANGLYLAKPNGAILPIDGMDVYLDLRGFNAENARPGTAAQFQFAVTGQAPPTDPPPHEVRFQAGLEQALTTRPPEPLNIPALFERPLNRWSLSEIDEVQLRGGLGNSELYDFFAEQYNMPPAAIRAYITALRQRQRINVAP